jgi:hypothetical protein
MRCLNLENLEFLLGLNAQMPEFVQKHLSIRRYSTVGAEL